MEWLFMLTQFSIGRAAGMLNIQDSLGLNTWQYNWIHL